MRAFIAAAAVVVGCSPNAQDTALPNPTMVSELPIEPGSAANSATGPQTTSTAPHRDTPAQAVGRRILSTAFVMVGPDRYLTVEQRDGRMLALRDVVMRAPDYCGVITRNDQLGTKFCGDYADVVSARPGGGPDASPHDLTAPSPAQPSSDPAVRD